LKDLNDRMDKKDYSKNISTFNVKEGIESLNNRLKSQKQEETLLNKDKSMIKDSNEVSFNDLNKLNQRNKEYANIARSNDL